MTTLTEVKNQMMNELKVEPTETFNVKQAIRQRIDYIKQYLKSTKRQAIVLGISGGVDSSTSGKLAQMAVEELREENYPAQFIAVRLPYDTQKDEDDAQQALDFINPDHIVTVNVKNGVDGIHDSVLTSLYEANFEENNAITTTDFAKGNVKARMRMIAQYEIAGLYKGLVLGTDHNAEAVSGFYTLHGDGACDFVVLDGLNKRQVRLCAQELGAPDWLWSKVATADLEDLNAQVSDEEALGVTYDQIDDLLEGKNIDKQAEKIILEHFDKTQFKRRMPMNFSEFYI